MPNPTGYAVCKKVRELQRFLSSASSPVEAAATLHMPPCHKTGLSSWSSGECGKCPRVQGCVSNVCMSNESCFEVLMTCPTSIVLLYNPARQQPYRPEGIINSMNSVTPVTNVVTSIAACLKESVRHTCTETAVSLQLQACLLTATLSGRRTYTQHTTPDYSTHS